MIDKKKIEEAASDYSKTLRENQTLSFAYRDFKEGVRWAQKEFIKELWHDASEEPEKNKKLLGYDVDGYSIYCWKDQETTWHEFVYNTVLQRWCYLLDILPQKGGNNE